MITQGFFILVSVYFFYFIFFKKFFVFGFKESFSIGLIFYIYLPLILIYFYNDLLIVTFPNFSGYKFVDIISIQYLSILLIASFFSGYVLTKKRARIFNFRQNYSNLTIFVTIFFILVLSFLIQNPNINIVILLSILCNLLAYRSKFSFIKKIFLLSLLAILFMYFSLEYSQARRHVIVILFISSFFFSLIIKSKIKFYLMFIAFLIVGILFTFLVTYLRTIILPGVHIDFILIPNLKNIISNYDFFPSFDNLMYIFNLKEYLYGKTLFKIFFSFIPREIWPTKPLDTNLLIVNLRQNFFVGGTSASITLLGEVFWNFGWPGTLVVFFLLGSLAKKFDKNFKKELYDSQLILLPSFTYLIFLLWRGSISTSLIIYLINIFFMFFLLNISKYVLIKKNIIN